MNESEIRSLLAKTKRIAVVGLSPVETRPSHYVAKYMQERGYKIFPVTPRAPRLLGERAYPNLRDVPGGIELVAVFRRPEYVAQIAREALWIRPQCFWMPPGAESEEAAKICRDHGIAVVLGLCLMETHRSLMK